MALYKFLKAGPAQLPTPRTCDTSIVTKKELIKANKNVEHVLTSQPRASKVLVTPRGTYNSYSAEEWAQIGRYAAENGNTRAASWMKGQRVHCK